MNDHNSSLVNLSIPESVTKPIVTAKIQEAVLAALGGSDKIIAGVIHQICNTKVDANGKVSTYDKDNNTTWMDYHVTRMIQEQVKLAITEQLNIASSVIKDELIKQLQSKKGATKVAEALLSAFDGTFGKSWSSSVQINFNAKND